MKQYTGIARQCRLVLAAMAALYFSAGLADESAAGDARSADGTDGGGETEGTVELDSMTITDRDSYRVPSTLTPSRLDVPLRDLPFSVGSITRPVIEDQRNIFVQDTYKNVSGVIPIGDLSSGRQGVGATIRGFEIDNEFFINGFRQQAQQAVTGPLDSANIERIDVLKGPAGLLFGSVSGPGGLINAVTKKPLADTRAHLAVSGGNNALVRPELDVTSSILPGGELLGRLNFAYTDTDGFVDFNDERTYFAAPALTWNISDRTRLDVEFNYNKVNDGVAVVGFPALEQSLDLPEDRFLGEPDFKTQNSTTQSWFVNFEHAFTDQWKFRFGGNYGDHNEEAQSFFAFGFANDADDCFADEPNINGPVVCRDAFEQANNTETLTLRGEIIGEFDTGPVRHKALIGGEHYRLNERFQFFPMDPVSLTDGADIATLNARDPDYSRGLVLQRLPIVEEFDGELFPNASINDGRVRVGSVYFEDFITLLPNLKIIGGGRYDDFTVKAIDTIFDSTERLDDSQFSGRAGIVWQPFTPTSLYFSWSESFFPQSGATLDGNALKPEEGEQFEVGIKQEIGENFSATLAAFHIIKENVASRTRATRFFRCPAASSAAGASNWISSDRPCPAGT